MEERPVVVKEDNMDKIEADVVPSETETNDDNKAHEKNVATNMDFPPAPFASKYRILESNPNSGLIFEFAYDEGEVTKIIGSVEMDEGLALLLASSITKICAMRNHKGLSDYYKGDEGDDI